MNRKFSNGFLDYWMGGLLIGSASREAETRLSINPAIHSPI